MHPILKMAQFVKKVHPEALALINKFVMETPSARIIRDAMARGHGMRGIEEVMDIAPIGGEVFIWYGRKRNTVTRIYLEKEISGDGLKWVIDVRFEAEGQQHDITLNPFEPDLNLRMCD